MCGRYSITTPPEAMARLFGLSGVLPNFPARFNVAPGQDVPAIIATDGVRELKFLRWGLVPSWAKSKPLVNARGESVAEKPSFREGFRHRRCLLPADGFYEWQRPDNASPDSASKVPFNICLAQGGPFAMAGIWEASDSAGVSTCAIITTDANRTLAPIHHRMPVILAPDDWEDWLSTRAADAESLTALLRPAPDDLLRAYAISTRVNRVANEGPENIAPAGSEPENESKQGNLF